MNLLMKQDAADVRQWKDFPDCDSAAWTAHRIPTGIITTWSCSALAACWNRQGRRVCGGPVTSEKDLDYHDRRVVEEQLGMI